MSGMEYDKEQKKALGAFYTPQVLSDLLARLSMTVRMPNALTWD